MDEQKLYGIVGHFDDAAGLYQGAKKAKEAGYVAFDTFSPFPIHGIEKAMGLKPSRLPWIVCAGGALGGIGGFALQTWAATSAYKLTISGKPFFSYPAFVPVTFELMVLFSAISAVFGMLFLNKLPQHHFSYFKSRNFRKATSHGFFVSVDVHDPLFDKDKISGFLTGLGGQNIEFIEE